MRIIIDFVMNHTSTTPWFQASRNDPEGPYGDFYVWSDDDTNKSPTRASSSSTPRSQLDLRPGAQAVLLARFFSHHQPDRTSRTRRSSRPSSTRCGSGWTWASTGSASTPSPTCSRRGDQLREPPQDPRAAQAGAQGRRRRVPRPGAAVRGQPVAGRRRRVLRRGRRRVPDGLPLPGHAAAVHGRPPGAAVPDLGDHGPDAGHPGELPVGRLPPQPRRADPREWSPTRNATTCGAIRQGTPG